MQRLARGNTVLLLLGDFVTFAGALLVTLLIRYREIPNEDVVSQHLQPFLILFCFWILTFFIAGLYDRHISLVRKSIPALVIRVQVLNMLVAALFFFVSAVGIEPKTNLVIYLIVSSTFIVLWRLYLYPRLTTGKPMRALVIGDSVEATGIARVFAHNRYFKHVTPYLLSRRDIPVFSDFKESFTQFLNQGSTDVVVADMRDEFVFRLAPELYHHAFEDRNIRFINLPSMYEELHHRIPPSLIGEAWLLENVGTGSPHYAYDFLKRAIDIVGAFLLLLPTVVVFPLVALAIRLEGDGPFFYTATRVGQFGRPIHIYKFRTMTGTDTPDAAVQSKLTVTKVGAVLRKTRLDELPQLLNVLKGDLSFIGPRPEIPTLVEVYAKEIPYYNLRHLVKPGLSGWAQINNFDVPRGGVDINRTIDKLSFDLYYLKHRSFLLDIEIALKTINTLVMRTGT
jgi:lipopolysaccharide/colanic/teichoic acid biosynthesis glycosyltransferase